MFYIDIGANDPKKFNNTYRFYQRGWTGINIEPNPALFERICEFRQTDININLGIGSDSGHLPFYVINPDTLSTFNKDVADKAVSDGFYLVDTIPIVLTRLDILLKDYQYVENIDFLSLDVEGFELSVLRSNDWNLFRPNFVLIEVNRAKQEIQDFFEKTGYSNVFENGTNAIYHDSNLISHDIFK